MKRVIEYKFVSPTAENGNNKYMEIAGLSTDSKPTAGLITGSLYFEVDTWKFYAFDEESAQWNPKPES